MLQSVRSLHDKFLLDYLEGMVKLRRSMHIPDEFRYAGTEDFLLNHGTFFKPRVLLASVRPMMLKLCFENAFRLASRTKAFHYVEGYAFWRHFPTLHAWCIDKDGFVVDPTWSGEMLGLSYFGVELNLLEVKQSRRVGCYALTDDWRRSFPALKGDPNVFAPDAWYRR